MTIYCYARFLRPPKRGLCGILGLSRFTGSPLQPYLEGRFCMPVVGGNPRSHLEPFEREASFDEMLSDLDGTHELGAAFDWPVPVESVRWRISLHHHYDGSCASLGSDLLWPEVHHHWILARGMQSLDCQLFFEIEARLVGCEQLALPSGYELSDCDYRGDSSVRTGVAQDYAKLEGLWGTTACRTGLKTPLDHKIGETNAQEQ